MRGRSVTNATPFLRSVGVNCLFEAVLLRQEEFHHFAGWEGRGKGRENREQKCCEQTAVPCYCSSRETSYSENGISQQHASITWCDLFRPNFGQKNARNYFCTWRPGAFKTSILASRDVIISSQICVSKFQSFFTLGDGCWLPRISYSENQVLNS